MAINILKPKSKTDVQTVAAFEKALGTKLPDDYRTFLLTYNGGRPEGNKFEYFAASPDQFDGGSMVDDFYGFLPQRKSGDLWYSLELMRERLPKGVIRIGHCCCGDGLCLSLIPDTYGHIYFWDHEFEAADGEPATFANLYLLSHSFDDFFRRKLKKFNPQKMGLGPKNVSSGWTSPQLLEILKQQKTYDLYGCDDPGGMESARRAIESALHIVMVAHKNPYVGDCYQSGKEGGERFNLWPNFPDPEEQEMKAEFREHPLLLYVNQTDRADEIKNKLDALKHFKFLRRYKF